MKNFSMKTILEALEEPTESVMAESIEDLFASEKKKKEEAKEAKSLISF